MLKRRRKILDPEHSARKLISSTKQTAIIFNAKYKEKELEKLRISVMAG